MSSEKRSVPEWLPPTVIAFGAAILTSLFTAWLTNKEIASAHTQVVFQRKLEVYEDIMHRLASINRFCTGSGVNASDFTYLRRPFQKDVYELNRKIKNPFGNPYLSLKEFMTEVEELGVLMDSKVFYISPSVDAKVESYLNAISSAMNTHQIGEVAHPIPEETTKAVQREYLKTVNEIRMAVGIPQIPFE